MARGQEWREFKKLIVSGSIAHESFNPLFPMCNLGSVRVLWMKESITKKSHQLSEVFRKWSNSSRVLNRVHVPHGKHMNSPESEWNDDWVWPKNK